MDNDTSSMSSCSSSIDLSITPAGSGSLLAPQGHLVPSSLSDVSNTVDIDSDSDASISSWHSCLSKPVRPNPPLALTHATSIEMCDLPITPGDISMLPVCVVRPNRIRVVAPNQVPVLEPTPRAYSPEIIVLYLHQFYNYMWGELNWLERSKLVAVFIGTTLVSKWILGMI